MVAPFTAFTRPMADMAGFMAIMDTGRVSMAAAGEGMAGGDVVGVETEGQWLAAACSTDR
jgi:hypothetical protein